MLVSIPDPQMRNERYWVTSEVSELEPGSLLLRPMGLEIGDKRLLEVGIDGRGSCVGLVVRACLEGIGILTGFRAVPIAAGETSPRELKREPDLRVDLDGVGVQIPVFRVGKQSFVRICERSSSYMVSRLGPQLSGEHRALFEGIGEVDARSSYIWLPYTGKVRLRLQEFPDVVCVATRRLGVDGAQDTELKTLPYHDWFIGELMERCGSARLEEIGQLSLGASPLPVRQFMGLPTARLEFEHLVGSDEDGWVGSSFGRRVSTSVLKSARLMSFSLAGEFASPPPSSRVVGMQEERLVLLDQGGADRPVIRTEPRKWRPSPDRSAVVVSNEIKFLVMVMNRGSTYRMRSEAVRDFRADRWASSKRFVLNELTFAGDRPVLATGDLALFTFETGQPELVMTGMGSVMSVVTKSRDVSVNVLITHVREDEGGRLYVDGYRCSGGLTAVPLGMLEPVNLIRGARLRWRPRPITAQILQRLAREGRLPLVFEDKFGVNNVAVSLLPRAFLCFPAPRAARASCGKPSDLAREGMRRLHPTQVKRDER